MDSKNTENRIKGNGVRTEPDNTTGFEHSSYTEETGFESYAYREEPVNYIPSQEELLFCADCGAPYKTSLGKMCKCGSTSGVREESLGDILEERISRLCSKIVRRRWSIVSLAFIAAFMFWCFAWLPHVVNTTPSYSHRAPIIVQERIVEVIPYAEYVKYVESKETTRRVGIISLGVFGGVTVTAIAMRKER